MGTLDRLLIFVGTGLMALGLWCGANMAGESSAASVAPRTFTAIGVYGADGSNRSQRKLKLPPGVRIDPNTGRMIGISLTGDANTTPVHWEMLRAYEYAKGLEGMPQEIRELDGKQVVMLGFLWAIYEPDDIRRFGLVASHWSCCYGIPPGLSDVVIVELRSGHAGLTQTLNPVRVSGTLRVEERTEGGYTTSIFALDNATASVLEY